MRLLIALVQTVLIVGIGVALFGVAIVGSLAVVAVLRRARRDCLPGTRLRHRVVCRTEEAANAMTSVVQFPLMFLSGIFFPIAFMPDWLQPVAALMPLTYLGDALRQTMVGGAAYAPLGVDALVLAGWLVVSFRHLGALLPLAVSALGVPSPPGRALVGTSGFAYPDWAPLFYPQGAAATRCFRSTPVDFRPSSSTTPSTNSRNPRRSLRGWPQRRPISASSSRPSAAAACAPSERPPLRPLSG